MGKMAHKDTGQRLYNPTHKPTNTLTLLSVDLFLLLVERAQAVDSKVNGALKHQTKCPVRLLSEL